jgi:hypothetical protein
MARRMNWGGANSRETMRRRGTESIRTQPEVSQVKPSLVAEGILNRQPTQGVIHYGGRLKWGEREYPVSIFRRDGKNGPFYSLKVYEPVPGKRKQSRLNLDRMMDRAMERDP